MDRPNSFGTPLRGRSRSRSRSATWKPWLAALCVAVTLVLVFAPFAHAARPRGVVTTKRIKKFTKWFNDNGGYLHPDIKLDIVKPEMGAGSMDEDETDDPFIRVVATKDLPGKEALSKTPVDLLLHPGLVDEETLPSGEGGFNDQERLVYLVAAETRDPASKWGPYFAVLPRMFHTPLHFTEEEVALLSDRPEQYGYAGLVAKQENKDFNSFATRVNSLPPSPSRKYKTFAVSTLRWAWSVVASRGFMLPARFAAGHSDVTGRPFLAPGSDFFNHRPKARMDIRIIEDSFHATGVDKTKAGDEVYVNYHQLPNAWILNNYGFVIDNNPHDFLPISLQVPFLSGSELENLKMHLLEELGLSQDIQLTPEGLTTELRNLLRVLGLNTTIGLDTRDEWVALDMKKDRLTVDAFTDARGLALMRRAVLRFLERYQLHDLYNDLTEEEEAVALKHPEAFREDDRFGWTFNGVLASRARVGEMRLLHNVLNQIDQQERILGIRLAVDEFDDYEEVDIASLPQPPTPPEKTEL